MAYPDQNFIQPDPTDVAAGLIYGGMVNLFDVESVSAADVPYPQERVERIGPTSGPDVEPVGDPIEQNGYFLLFNMRDPMKRAERWRFSTPEYRDAKLEAIADLIATILAPASS